MTHPSQLSQVETTVFQQFNLQNTVLPVSRLLPDHSLSLLISMSASSSQAAPLSYSPCFPNIQNPILSPIFLEAFVFWSIVSLPTLGTFRLLSSFNILLYVPFKIHSGFTFLELSTNRLCFHFVSGFQRHGYHLALIFVQKAFALLLKSSTLTFSPLATILWPFNRPIYSFK